jgi:CysZ protein
MLQSFVKGMGYLASGVKLARTREVRPFLFIPLLTNLLLFSAAGYLLFGQLNWLIEQLQWQADFPAWLDWLEGTVNTLFGTLKWLLLIAGLLLMLILFGSVFTFFTHLLASPFIGLLGEKVERQLHTVDYPPLQLHAIAWRSFRRELTKMRYWFVRAVGLGLLTLVCYAIPPLQTLTPILWYLFGAWMMAMNYLDVPADNNQVSFPEMLAWMRQHRSEAMGFGGAVTLVTATPLLNLFIIPVAVAGAVLFWTEHAVPTRPKS